MPNLRDIKTRIKSIKNTQKITQAMRMVAAAKVKKAENLVKASRPFTTELVETFKRLIASNPQLDAGDIKIEKAIDNYPALLKKRDIKTVGMLIITSDKGLAGAYNANVVRYAVSNIKELNAKGLSVELFVVGSKGIAALKRELPKVDAKIAKTYTKMPAIPTTGAASMVAEDIAEYFVDNKIDTIDIISTKFKSMLSYTVGCFNVLPIKVEEQEKKEDGLRSEMLFEPSPEVVLQKVVPHYITNTIYLSLIEAAASELAARMQAMSNATSNASDMINLLTIQYNKARQASITQEILEVVSGADALSG